MDHRETHLLPPLPWWLLSASLDLFLTPYKCRTAAVSFSCSGLSAIPSNTASGHNATNPPAIMAAWRRGNGKQALVSFHPHYGAQEGAALHLHQRDQLEILMGANPFTTWTQHGE